MFLIFCSLKTSKRQALFSQKTTNWGWGNRNKLKWVVNVAKIGVNLESTRIENVTFQYDLNQIISDPNYILKN